jgi:hypothetical protein
MVGGSRKALTGPAVDAYSENVGKEVHPNMEKSHSTWMVLTHNGRRSPRHPTCSHCGETMTEAEIAERLRRWPERPITQEERGEARCLYSEAIDG